MPGLLEGKRGLVMGVANDRSIAWGIARALAAQGAELAFTYQGEAFGKRVEPLAASLGSDILLDVDVTNDASLEAAFAALEDRWGRLAPLAAAGARVARRVKATAIPPEAPARPVARLRGEGASAGPTESEAGGRSMARVSFLGPPVLARDTGPVELVGSDGPKAPTALNDSAGSLTSPLPSLHLRFIGFRSSPGPRG